MTSLWTSDIHIDGSPKNEYRWSILPWLEKTALAKKVDFVGINGDLTEAKDKHSASVVNRVVEFFAKSKNQWLINTGNHDYFDPDCPFFGFLRNFENVRWIRKPTSIKLPVAADYTQTLILPSTKNWESWLSFFDDGKSYPYIFVHATFNGTPTETGHVLSGVPVNFFPRQQYGRIFAGDIHMPGTVTRRIDYIGSPHRVYFGDTFEPRVLWITKKEIYDINPPGIKRYVVVIRRQSDLEKFEEIVPGDQVKIRVRLRRSDFPEWMKLRRDLASEAGKLGWDVRGIEIAELLASRQRLHGDTVEKAHTKHLTPQARLLAFAESRSFSDAETKFGLSLLS